MNSMIFNSMIFRTILPFRKSYLVLLGFSEDGLYLVIYLCNIYLGFPQVIIFAILLQSSTSCSNISQCVSIYNLYMQTKHIQHLSLGKLHLLPVLNVKYETINIDFVVKLQKVHEIWYNTDYSRLYVK